MSYNVVYALIFALVHDIHQHLKEIAMSEITIKPIERPSVLKVPAHKVRQGGRTAFYFTLRMAQFDDLLPEEVDTKIIKHQRRFVPSHAKAILEYLESTDNWIMGPVTLSIDPVFMDFQAYSGQDGSTSLVGELTITEGGRSALRILDGQHRRHAIKEYRRSHFADEPERIRQRQFDECQMPIALYVEEDTKRINQMFADMAQQKPMDAVTRARFDMRDPFNRAAEQVMEESEWIRPFVEMNISIVPRSSGMVVAFNQLAANLKTLMFGYYGRVSRNRRLELDNDIQSIVETGIDWTDDFLPNAREEYLELQDQNIDEDFVPKRRHRTLAYHGTMLRILASCCHEWKSEYPDLERMHLERYISSIDLHPTRNSGILVESGALTPNGSFVARRQEVKSAIQGIVKRAYGEYVGDSG